MTQEATTSTLDIDTIDIDAAVNKVLATKESTTDIESESTEVSAESEQVSAEAQASGEDAGDAPGPGEATQEAQEAVEETAPAPELKASQLAILARREARLKEKEAAIEKQLEEARAGIRDSVTQELKSQFQRNPAAFAKQLGIDDLGAVAQLLWGAELGEEAPDEIKTKLAQQEMMEELRYLRTKLDEREKKPDQTRDQIVMQIRAEAAERELDSLVASEKYPLLAKYAALEPDEVRSALHQSYATTYQQTGTWPDSVDIVEAAEQRLAAQAALLSGTAQEAKAEKPKTARKAEEPRTLSEADIKQSPDRNTVDLTNMDDEEWMQYAVKAAHKHLKKQ